MGIIGALCRPGEGETAAMPPLSVLSERGPFSTCLGHPSVSLIKVGHVVRMMEVLSGRFDGGGSHGVACCRDPVNSNLAQID